MKSKKLAILLLIPLMAMSIWASPVKAVTEAEMKASEEEKLNAAKSEKEKLEQYLTEISNAAAILGQQAAEAEMRCNEKQQEIEETSAALSKAEADAKLQYENMKKRIKLIYERGYSGYLESILTSGSIAEAINRTSYVSEVFGFDQNLLDKYQATVDEVANKKSQLEEERSQLEALKAEAEAKQEEAKANIAKSRTELQAYLNTISNSEQLIKDLEEQMNNKKNIGTGGSESASGNNSNAQNSNKQNSSNQNNNSQNQNAAQNNNSSPNNNSNQGGSQPLYTVGEAISVDEEDLNMMAAMVYCEAGAEGYEEKLGVASVIVNRLKSSRYPNTMSSVLWQSGQFAPTWEGKFAIQLAKTPPAPESCYQACREALSGTSNVGNAIGFKLAETGIEGIVIGKIVFF